MSESTWDKQIERHRRFLRLVDALARAERRAMHFTAEGFRKLLLDNGCWQDDAGDWREDTRPIKPIADLPDGTWADNHDEF